MNRRQFLRGAALTTAGLIVADTNFTLARIPQRSVKCPILMYHYISPLPEDADTYRRDLTVEPDRFESHCAFLQENGYTTISMEKLYQALFEKAELPEKPVVLTFDDGYADAAAFAFPILQKYRLVGTFFIVQNFMETPGYLSWGQAKAMLDAGMEIENHSATHPNLRVVRGKALLAETGGAADVIGEVLGKRARFFCYPLGRFNNETIRALRATGHLMAMTTQDGTVHFNSNPFRLKRVRIRNTTGINGLAWLLDRAV